MLYCYYDYYIPWSISRKNTHNSPFPGGAGRKNWTMKHFLPILTVTLSLAATTASAEHFYYDYYKDPGISGITEFNGRETDTVSYGDFEIERFSQANNGLVSEDGSNNTNLYKIRITGGDPDKGEQVKLYLTDFVKSLTDTSQALYNNVTRYGYRVLNPDGTVGETQYIDMVDASQLTEKDVIDTGRLNAYNDPVNRYKYELGTFGKDTELELYMEQGDNSAYSYNGLSESALGGYGDGGYYENGIVEQTDGLLYLYHFNSSIDSLSHDYTQFDADMKTAANKAMPLAGLDIIGADRNRVYFGIIGETVVVQDKTFGQPLPGGLQIALIAGLFGLGFWYIRRRKAAVA